MPSVRIWPRLMAPWCCQFGLDSLSTHHSGREGMAGEEPHVHFHLVRTSSEETSQ